MTSRAAPRALLTEPLRSRVAVITGALSGVLAVAISALRPFTVHRKKGVVGWRAGCSTVCADQST